MFIPQVDVDGGVKGRQSVTKTSLRLSNLLAGTMGTRKSETKEPGQSIITEGDLVAAKASPLSKKKF